LPIDRLVAKAEKLLESHRVESIGPGVYNVIGDHGTYTVVLDLWGNVSCNCQGYLKNKRCSHALAVKILTTSGAKRLYKPETRKGK
jgi:hypothetical protein